MKIYLASQYSWKERLIDYAKQLREDGIIVTSRWLEEPHKSNSLMSDVSESLLTEYATCDLEDTEAADIVVFFSVPETQPTSRGGRHVEFGYALAKGIPIYVVGPKENIFHYHGLVRHFATWDDVYDYICFRQILQSENG
jgi:nucleoside 2-deoxyribosyltransferase